MVFFALLGAADRIFGGRFGLGEKFEEGIMAMGPLTISMAKKIPANMAGSAPIF